MGTSGKLWKLVGIFAERLTLGNGKSSLFAAVAILALPAMLAAQGGKTPTEVPWQLDQAILATASNQGTTDLACGTHFRVPDGKRLIVEFISAYGILPQGQAWLRLHVETMVSGSNGGQPILHQFAPQFAGTNTAVPNFDTNATTPVDYSSVSQQTQLYSDPGTFVRACAIRNGNTGIAILRVSLSGRLLNAP